MNGIQKVIKILAICLGIIIIVNIFSACLYGLSFLTGIDYKEDKNLNNFEEIYKNVEKIEINAIASNITIKSGNEFKVEAHNVEDNFSAQVNNKTLKIIEKQNIFNNNYKGHIIVTVPNGTTLKKLSIDTGAGKFIINDISSNSFEMDHGAGILTITNSNFNNTDIDGGAGKITINSSTLNNLDMDAGVGEVEIEANITGDSEINCGVGEVNITLLGNKDDYSIRTEKGIGSIKINNENQESNSVYGNGSNKIELEGGVGSISVSFKD